jgi:DNA-binding protein HU-beta
VNKGQLIEEVAAQLGATKAAASRATMAVIRSITGGIKRDNAVTISGFGTFTRKDRPARTVRNPATGEPLHIKPSRTVNFKPSQALKKTV